MIRGLRGAKESFRLQGKDLESKVKREIERAGRLTERDAKRDAPKDTNTLYKSISYESTRNGLGARVSSNVKYAPYQEFGTGGKVDIPDGFEELAAQFKGRRQIDMKAQPYLIPNAKKNYELMVRRLKQIL